MLKRLTCLVILFVFIVAAMAGCAARSSGVAQSRPDIALTQPSAAATPKPNSEKLAGAASGDSSEEGTALAVDPNRKLIRNGELYIESLDFDKSMDGLYKLLSDLGGYVESSYITGVSKESSGKEQLRNAQLTVRVPSKQFDAFINGSGNIGNLLRQSTNSDDVTDSYYDTQARLASQQLMEQRLLVLLSKSDNITDILSLEKSLADVRYQIENLTGTLKKWDLLVEYSSFTVIISEVAQISENEPIAKTFWQRLANNFNNSIKGVWNGLKAFVVFLAGALPYIVVWGIIIAVIVLLILKFRNKKAKIVKNKPERQITVQPDEFHDEQE